VTLSLTDLLKGIEKGRKSGLFKWTNIIKESFKALKIAFTTAPILTHFDPLRKIRLEMDAFKFIITGTIS
jgi:hypothetical protein